MSLPFTEWERLGLERIEDEGRKYSHVEVEQREGLAAEIMAAAIRHVHKLGFTMKVCGNRNSPIKTDLQPENIYYYHPNKR